MPAPVQQLCHTKLLSLLCSCRQQLRLLKAPIGITETESPHGSALISSRVLFTALLHFNMPLPTCFWDVAAPESVIFTPSGASLSLHWKLWWHLLTSVSSSCCCPAACERGHDPQRCRVSHEVSLSVKTQHHIVFLEHVHTLKSWYFGSSYLC